MALEELDVALYAASGESQITLTSAFLRDRPILS